MFAQALLSNNDLQQEYGEINFDLKDEGDQGIDFSGFGITMS